jgi:hypothetical protein
LGHLPEQDQGEDGKHTPVEQTRTPPPGRATRFRRRCFCSLCRRQSAVPWCVLLPHWSTRFPSIKFNAACLLALLRKGLVSSVHEGWAEKKKCASRFLFVFVKNILHLLRQFCRGRCAGHPSHSACRRHCNDTRCREHGRGGGRAPADAPSRGEDRLLSSDVQRQYCSVLHEYSQR